MKLVLVLVAVLGLVGCTVLHEGRVIGKEFIPQHKSVWYSTIKVGKYAFITIPHEYVVSDAWHLFIGARNSDVREWHTVSHPDFDSHEVGTYWKDPKWKPNP